MNVVITMTNVILINIVFIAFHIVILTITANYVCSADLITLNIFRILVPITLLHYLLHH